MVLPSSVKAARQAQARLMPGRVNIERATRVPDPSGGMTTEWLPVDEGVKFRLMPGGAGERQLDQTIADRLGNRAPYFAYVEATVPVNSKDRLHQTFPVDKVYEILAETNPDVSFKTATRLIVAEVM